MRDLIERQAAIDAMNSYYELVETATQAGVILGCIDCITMLPSTQPERDIPVKPNETIDRAWGISNRQAVCPNCDCYLGMVHFLGEGKHKVTYCESCGQAIDWEGWEQDEID